ncbi:ATP-binding protein [Polaromonas naphthalenivorans]|uniref:Orc1-like AAA ATPase domain-containing protein n=1 Tax=Polaromonas naphthalenivorans (strain CJ2) TaxID=365044 RepID=A1VVN6_POLNA|nr:ATP-binding protein [Polaromonas naphthalenivorans]ABM39714.1 hypothetical protein Pnap_4437 [Polaromonas naphthalenivorans CJ2]
MSSGNDAKIEEALQASLAKAAMLGMFSPLELLDANDPIQLAALQQLATECAEVLHDHQALWQLSTDARSRTLLQLKHYGTLAQHARDAQPAKSDRLGHFLKKIILGDDITRSRLSTDDLVYLRTALQLTVPVAERGDVSKWVEDLVAKRDAEAAVQTLLPKKLIGRERQLRRLREFVYQNTGLADDFILWLTGVGGVGKSALLAQFVRELRGDEWGGVPVLTIDFDRPAFYQGRLSSIFLEMSRQLELFRPQMSEALSDFRETVRRNEAKKDNTRFHDRATSGIALLSAWKECVRDHLPLIGEVVVVFDTLEEVSSSGNLSLNELASWLHRLRAAGFPHLRSIFSGRAFYPEFSRGLPIHSQLDLGDLTAAAAVKLLQAMVGDQISIDVGLLRSLIDMLGGNPLMLKILAVHLRDGGRTAAHELLADRSNFDRQFAQTFLYKRLLGRIRTDDPDLVKVAHPGLILRRVTPDLIQQVLAVPCGLGEVSNARARDLFDKLSQQVWLVQPSGENAVLHRKDLRRLMLQAMTATDVERAAAVHLSAMAYYADYLDPVLTREQQRIEYHYHCMLTSAVELPPPELIPAFVRALGDDIETLPPAWRASLKVGSQQKLMTAEADTLQQPESVRYAGDVERRTVLETGYATSSKQSASDGDMQAQDPRAVLNRAQNAFESGELASVLSSAQIAIQEFGSPNREPDSRDFTDSTVWRVAICSLRQSNRFTSSLDRSFTRIDPKSVYQPLSFSSRDPLTLGSAYFMLYRLHGKNPPDQRVSVPQHGSTIENVAALRCWQLGGVMPARSGFEVRLRLLCDLADGFEPSNAARLEPLSLDRAGNKELAIRSRAHVAGLTYSLHELNRLRPEQGCMYIEDEASLRSEDHRKLRGLTPEIYPLVRAAARKCALKVLVEFSESMAAHRYWPSELGRVELRKNLREERERWTSAFIEVVDRHGELLNLVNHLIERGRGTRPLMQVVRDYDSRLKDFFNPG